MDNKKVVIREYDRRGEPPFLGMPAKFHELCVRVAGNLHGRVLDIGCGHGILLERARARWPGLAPCGCDFSAVMCSRTRARNPTAAVAQADAEALPFGDRRFDHVFMVEVLEHVPDARRALAEVRRVLRPGGTFLVAVPNRDWFHYEAHMQAREKNRPLEAQWHWYGAREIRELLAACGFTAEKVRGGENLYFGGGLPRELEKLALFLVPGLHEKSKRLIIRSVRAI